MMHKINLKLILTVSLIGVITFSLKNATYSYPLNSIAQNCPNAQRGTSQNCPLPINFSQGSYGALINDHLSATPQMRYYSLSARSGQRLTLSFAGAGPLRAGITFPNNSGDGPFSGDGNTIELPQTGTYIIYIGQNTMSGQPWRGNFTMAVIVK
ncbi:hypothetical protein PCC7424_3463 [Gloeothece citriformis PCC 7424]|uniref:Peptidase domain protein n=1 Tax=Gloeothece citriformis (strain PCC 7424) TaxID=65393 RepID=B7KFE0_GLOC7|nr:hypothetical protein [Gloeothece citriformis]ACK71856.1 hypothetical protein PCC7424_3463 [Gloeothece citriformis PCC 7424]